MSFNSDLDLDSDSKVNFHLNNIPKNLLSDTLLPIWKQMAHIKIELEKFENNLSNDLINNLKYYQERINLIENIYKINGIWKNPNLIDLDYINNKNIPPGQAVLSSVINDIHDIINRIQDNSNELKIGKLSNIHPLIDHARAALGENIIHNNINSHDIKQSKDHIHKPIN